MEKNPNNLESPEEAPTSNPRKGSNTAVCDICFQPYHIMGRWPMLACQNQHFFCDHCIEDMFRHNANEPVPCPMCRILIRPSLIKPHYQLFRSINKLPTVKQALKSEQSELILYAFEHQIFQVAAAFKSGKPETIYKINKLDCSYRKIYKIEHLQLMQGLIYLRLDGNFINKLSGLSSLVNLRYLNLSHNFIEDISLLEGLKKLRHLAVEFNQIKQIQSLLPFSTLSHLFLLGNPLKSITVQEFLLVEFKNLLSLSISNSLSEQQKVTMAFLKGVALCQTMPKLYRIFAKDIFPSNVKRQIQQQLRNRIKVQWMSQQGARTIHSDSINSIITQSHQYGQVFQFKPDPLCPHIKQYSSKGDQIRKTSVNFTIINSAHCLQKEGKVNFKLKIETPSQHIVVGLCNAFVKQNANIYSQHFIGLTFWGGIYARGEYSPLSGKLRLQDKPVIRMSVDFEQGRIRWFSDDIEVGAIPFPQQFRHSSLFFLLGMRDPDTSVLILRE